MSKIHRTQLTQEIITRCHKTIDELVELYKDTDPEKGVSSETDKQEKAFIALNKIGYVTGVLTEWAENQIFGCYYNIAKSKDHWISQEVCNRHTNELMWYGDDIPEDAFSNDDHLNCERVAIGTILKNSFSRYGRMGWRLSLAESLFALNEGQVEWLLNPTNTNKQGNAYDIQKLKWAAVKHVYKLIGEGWKKSAAQQKVAESCGTTFEAIKKWEKEAIKERDKDKDHLKSIQLGALYVLKTLETGKLDEGEILLQAVSWNLNCGDDSSDDTPLKNLSFGIIESIQLNKDYPLEALKQNLIDAGMRIFT